MTKLFHYPRFLSIFANFLFWVFNLPPVLIVLIALINLIRSLNDFNLIKQSIQSTPIDISITLIIVFAMPIISLIWYIFAKSYRQPIKLFQILFGIELPVIAFTIGRLIFLKTLTPVNILFLSTAVLSISTYLIYIFKKSSRNKFLLTIQLLLAQSAVIVGIYASLLMFFFIPITIASLIQNLSFGYFWYHQNILEFLTQVIFFVFYITLPLFLICSPFIGLFTYWRATIRLSIDLKSARLAKWIFSLSYFLIVISLAYQGSLIAFYSNMDWYKSTATFEGRSPIASKILKQENFVKNRLVDTYLASYIYLTDNRMTFLEQAYKDQLKTNPFTAKGIQNWFTIIASPFVYNGKFEEDVKKAGEYYQDIFDEPIQLAESKKVSRTLATSFNLFSRDQLKSSVLDRNDNDVRLVKRTVSAKPDSTSQFATVTIEEEYENTTNSPQEVFYIFSLPQDSVITDLKLGADLELGREQPPILSTPTKSILPQKTLTLTIPQPVEDKNQAQVAPKGAANQTFENQYRRRLDPAIIEQVGPVQYQLRVYPIPVKEENLSEWQRNSLREPVKNQKVRYSYVTILNADGQASLPKFTESRNVFNGFGVKPMDSNIKVTTFDSHSLQLTNGDWKTFYVPYNMKTPINDADISKIPNNTRIAILADSSYSMGISNWRSYLEKELSLSNLLKNNIVDLYYFNDLTSKSISLNEQINNPKIWQQTAFGKTNRLQALKQVEGKYDVTLMFTDSSSADNPGDSKSTPNLGQPVYIIHKDGIIPKLPDNLTYYLQVNSGRAVNSGNEALREFAKYQWLKENNKEAFVLTTESGAWIVDKNNDNFVFGNLKPAQLNLDEPVGKLAMHRQIEAMMMSNTGKLNDPAFLDELNRLAINSDIVTPFSSFIVLVTPEQKEQLRLASLNNNRYLVNYDLGEDTTINPGSGGLLGTSAVPEPHEWILILTSFGLVVFLGRRQIQSLLVR